MKKYLLIALAFLFAFASCSKESNETPEMNTERSVELSFSSKRPQLKSESKTAWDGSTIVWTEGDKIRMGYTLDGHWMNKDAVADDPRFYSSKAVVINEANSSIGTFTSESPLADPGEGTYVFYGYYPAAANSTVLQSSAPEVSLNLPWSQTPGSNTFDAAADIMIGKSESQVLPSLPEDPVEILWSRLVAHADLTFTNLAFVGTETISSITLTANENFAGTFTANLSDGTFSLGTSNKVVLGGANLTPTSNSVEAWCCILPITITSLDVVVVTNKAKYTRSITGISKTFKQNARNRLSINMSTATRVEESAVYSLFSGNIEEGDYVIVYNNYALKNVVSSKRLSYSSVSVTNDKITNPDESIVWHIAPSGSYWTIYNASVEQFAAATGSKNEAQLLADGTDNKSLWSVSVSSNSTYNFANKARAEASNPDNKYLRLNEGYGFACYASSTGGPLTLYKLGDGGGVTPSTFTTVAELNALATSEATEVSGTLTNAIVSFKPNDNNAIIKDATGSILVYVNNHGLLQGQTMTGDITATIKLYHSCSEIEAFTATFTGSGASVSPEVLTLSDLVGNLNTYQNAYVKVEGLSVTAVSGKNVTVSDGTNTYVVFTSYGSATCVGGDVITVEGTVTHYGENDQIQVWSSDDITITSHTSSTTTIAGVISGGAGTYEVENVLVYAVKGAGLIIGDDTGKMYAYKSNHGLSVGDVRTVNGTTKIYNEAYEFDGPAFSGSGTATVNHGTAVEFDNVASTLQADFANPHTAVYVHATGTQSGRYITTTGGNVLYLSAAETTTDGKGVEIYGYVYAYSATHSNFNIMVTSIEVDNSVASLNVNPTSLSWLASETDSKIITVEINDNASGYSISPTNSTDWNISKTGNTITVSPKAANASTTNAKTLTLTITHNDDSSLKEDVTLTQDKASSGGTMIIDFESAVDSYSDWTFTNMTSQQTGSITAHGGTYYGTTGGKTTASIVTKNKIASPGTLTVNFSKQSTNTTTSTWYIQVSSDGTTWTDVKTQSATSMGQGTWVTVSQDLSSYSNVYVRVYYDGSTAVRNIDDLSLTY